METLQAVIGKRDSEFTGLKGQLLRYLGTAFFFTVFGLLLVAAGERHHVIAVATEPLSDLFFACAISLYPVCTCWSHLARMSHAYRAGGAFELAGIVLALYGREGAAHAEAEQGSMLESAELVAAMREEGASAVIARFGRDRTYRMCQAIYLAGIVGFGIVFVAMLAIAPF